MIINHLVKNKNKIFISFLCSLSVLCTAMEKGIDVMSSEQMRHLLLYNPKQISQAHQKRYKKFNEWNNDRIKQDHIPVDVYTNQLLQHIQKKQQKSPLLFLIRECSHQCMLSRLENPYWRQMFEQKATALMCGVLQIKQGQPVVCTSFGSGYALQDLIFWTKVLQECPNAQLDIHMIDTLFSRLITFKKRSHTNPHLVEDSQINVDGYKQLLMSYFSIKGDETFSCEMLQSIKKDISTLVQTEYLYNCLLFWLHTHYPKAHISLCLHKNSQKYCTYLEKKQLSHADLIVAADIADFSDEHSRYLWDYYLLCSKTLEHNPLSCNVWLDAGWGKWGKDICLATLTAQPTSSDQKPINNERHQDAIPLYETVEKLEYIYSWEDSSNGFVAW